ncbi:hypothetical protein [Vallitalea okinawensis]|uniref:hypothetical protein n=1 Tax=Vallitalea okinawensis TaxID=2078660 RepID=UPI000CFC132A|nr:hypothetical protein [Vallitalea okinawensis]
MNTLKNDSIDVKQVIHEEIQSCERKIKLSIIQIIPLLSILILIIKTVLNTTVGYYTNNSNSIIYWIALTSNGWVTLFLIINQFYRKKTIENLSIKQISRLDKKKGLWGYVVEIFLVITVALTNLFVIVRMNGFPYKVGYIIYFIIAVIGFIGKLNFIYIQYIKCINNNDLTSNNDDDLPSDNRNKTSAIFGFVIIHIMFFILCIIHMLYEEMYWVEMEVFILGISIASFFVFLSLIFRCLGTYYEIIWLMELDTRLRFKRFDENKVLNILEEQYIDRFRTELIHVEDSDFE